MIEFEKTSPPVLLRTARILDLYVNEGDFLI